MRKSFKCFTTDGRRTVETVTPRFGTGRYALWRALVDLGMDAGHAMTVAL